MAFSKGIWQSAKRCSYVHDNEKKSTKIVYCLIEDMDKGSKTSVKSLCGTINDFKVE